ncbi:integrase [Anopheles sinensis]|uniref:Integrase n=1 Tax=Anopheles sinensis TaxID=74873 RepID=A0A084W1A4_ANOSI|nr:integrase [Anopheles sinensis]
MGQLNKHSTGPHPATVIGHRVAWRRYQLFVLARAKKVQKAANPLEVEGKAIREGPCRARGSSKDSPAERFLVAQG